MASQELGFNITALDNASKTFTKMAAQVERFSARLDKLDRKDVNIDVNTRGTAAAAAELGTLSVASNVLARASTGMSVAVVGAIAALPMLSAGAVAATGAVGGLAAVTSVAVAGVGAFGAAAAGNIAKVTEVADEVRKLNEELARTKGAKERAEIIRERTRLLSQLNPAQLALMRSINGARAAYERFLDVTARPVATALTPWLQSARPLFRRLAPVVREVSKAIRGLGVTARLDVRDGFIGGFLKFLRGRTGGVVRQFGGIFRNAFKAIAGIIRQFWPLGQDILDWLSGLMVRVEQWVNSPEGHRQIRRFMQMVRDVGPAVWKAIKNVAQAIGAVMGAFTEDGKTGLNLLSRFFRWVANHPHGVKRALYGMAAALTAVGVALAISTGGLSLIIPLVVAFGATVGFYFPQIKKLAKDLFKFWRFIFTTAMPAAWRLFRRKIVQGWNTFKNFFIKTIPNNIQRGWDAVRRGWDTFKRFWIRSWNGFKNFWINQWNHFKNTTIRVAAALWDRVKQGWNTFKNFWVGSWRRLTDRVVAIVAGLAAGVMDRLRGLADRIAGWGGSARRWLLQAGRDVLLGFLDGLRAIWDRVTDFISGIGSWIREHKGPIGLDRDLLVPAGRAIMGGFERGLRSRFGPIGAAVRAVTGDVVAAVRGVASMFGWARGANWRALVALINSESGWDPGAANPISSARGLFQKMTSLHGPVEPTAAGQAMWGLRYIAGRYGDPMAAWAFKRAHNWYGHGLEGGVFRTPTLIGVGESGPERVDVTPIKAAGPGGGTGGVTIYNTNYLSDPVDVDMLSARQGFQARAASFG